MSSNLAYAMPSTPIVLSHFPGRRFFVRDIDEDVEMLLEARIRSGDYVLTLATELDKLAQSLAAGNAPEAVDLERLVSELLVINKKYTLEKK
jgi:hypothetical protein